MLSLLIRMSKIFINYLTGRYRDTKPPPLPLMGDGRKATEVLEKRIMGGFARKMQKQFPKAPYRDYTFEKLFDLPDWLDIETWLFVQLRGRGVDSLLESTVDHISPLNNAKTPEELIKLHSWANIRLLDVDINSSKSDPLDAENTHLGKSILEKPVVKGKNRPNPYEQQKATENGDRFAKLMSRGRGMSHRQKVNGKDATKDKKDYRNKKRR